MEHLDGALRPYPWGSRTLLAQLRGEPAPTAQPEAELWFGAHPGSPSRINGTGLDEIIAADPVGALGERVAAQHNGELPFLVKLLAADAPLSIQAHPSREQAEDGFARENAEGIPLQDPRRNYKDPNPKPELIVALTTFRALAGFRPPAKTAELFQALRAPELDRYASLLPAGESDDALRALFTTLISLPQQARSSLLDAVSDAAAAVVEAGDAEEWIVDTASVFLELSRRYPGDVGAFAALLLNLVTLEPGEAAFLGAGQLHAYLSGLGVEVMWNSDNVLRGGLTTKHVDVGELVRVLDFAPLDSPRARRVDTAEGSVFDLPVDSFSVSVHTLSGETPLTVDTDGPAIVLCTAGEAVSGDFVLRPAQAAWIAANEAPVTFTAAGEQAAELFVATA